MQPDPQRDLQALLREEPYVRALARLLCDGHADEIVQQTWLQAIEHGGGPIEHPRPWLGRIVRNVVHNFRRGERRRRSREHAAARPDVAPSSIELMQREERRRTLVGLVDALPHEQRAVMLLRYFDGLPPRKIALRLGLPVGTVWNLHRRALERLRRTLDETARRQGDDDRRVWLLPLVTRPHLPQPITPPPALPASLVKGAIAMTLKTKMTAAATALLAMAIYVWWSTDTNPSASPVTGPATSAADLVRVQLDGDGDAPNPGPEIDPQRQAVGVPVAAVATTGALTVHVYFGGDERLAANGVTLSWRYSTGDLRTARRGVTDADGMVTFDGLSPGRVHVWGDRFDPTRGADIVAGETTQLDLTLPVGMLLRGQVLDTADLPIAGARIELAEPGLLGRDPDVLATSDADGRFIVRGAPRPSLVGARATGYLASRLQSAYAEDGHEVEVTLRLTSGGGTVDGLVLGPDGTPVDGALICVGAGEVQGLTPTMAAQPAMPALVRSDADGRFRAMGLEPGDQPIWVRAAEMAPWRGSCVVVEHTTSGLRIDLQAGAVLRGIVSAADGSPVANTEIHLGTWGEAEHTYARSAADGSFELRGLPGGEVEIHAEHDDEGEASLVVSLVGGSVRDCELHLSRGLELRGRVLAQDEAGVAKVFVEVDAARTREAPAWRGFARTDEAGRFAVANCPVARPLRVAFSGETIESHRLEAVDPRDGDLLVRVRRIEASVHIVGSVQDPEGRPMAGVRISPWCDGRELRPDQILTAADGAFAFGPLPPGTWRLSIDCEDYPPPVFEPRTLRAGERWDLGIVRFAVGGTAILHPGSVPASALRFMLADTTSDRRWSIRNDREHPETPLLTAGDYLLMVWGEQAAARVVPLTITAGQQTEVELNTEPGVRQHLEFIAEADVDVGHGATLSLFRGQEKLVDWWVPTQRGEAWTCDLWLLPGRYRVTMVGKLRGAAELTVGAGEPEVVRIAMW